jgi:hypothetical protein
VAARFIRTSLPHGQEGQEQSGRERLPFSLRRGWRLLPSPGFRREGSSISSRRIPTAYWLPVLLPLPSLGLQHLFNLAS